MNYFYALADQLRDQSQLRVQTQLRDQSKLCDQTQLRVQSQLRDQSQLRVLSQLRNQTQLRDQSRLRVQKEKTPENQLPAGPATVQQQVQASGTRQPGRAGKDVLLGRPQLLQHGYSRLQRRLRKQTFILTRCAVYKNYLKIIEERQGLQRQGRDSVKSRSRRRSFLVPLSYSEFHQPHLPECGGVQQSSNPCQSFPLLSGLGNLPSFGNLPSLPNLPSVGSIGNEIIHVIAPGSSSGSSSSSSSSGSNGGGLGGGGSNGGGSNGGDGDNEDYDYSDGGSSDNNSNRIKKRRKPAQSTSSSLLSNIRPVIERPDRYVDYYSGTLTEIAVVPDAFELCDDEFEDSDRFEEDSLCSWSTEAESVCNNWRGWKRPTGSSNLFNGKKTSTEVNRLPQLCELAARCVASHIPFELVEHVYPPVPEQLQLRIAYWSFPDNEEDIRLYSCLANSSSDEFLRGEQMFRARAVKEPLQIGFHLSATVCHPAQYSQRGQYNVAITFDRRRITSCNCTCNSSAYWCSHIVAVCLHRIHLPNQVCLRAPVSESLSRLHRDQLQKFAQYLISELPQQILPTAQRILDELLSSQPSAINSVCGAPDPTAGASVNEQTSWYLDEKTLHDNIRKILIKFCVPAPIVFSDVNYLSTTAPPAAAEWTSLLRPLRGREPEGMWNLLSIVREMFRRNDRNALPLLQIITDECLACEQIMVWWFNTKVALHVGVSGGGRHSSVNSHGAQHACASLCDEVVILWRLAALNPALSSQERTTFKNHFSEWHMKIIEKVEKNRNIHSSTSGYQAERLTKNLSTSIDVFSGFKPAIAACQMDWDDYPIPGVTYQGGASWLSQPITCFKNSDSKTESTVNQQINPISHQLSVMASDTLAKCGFLCTVLAENAEHYHLAFRVGLFGLEMARPPATTKPLEVKLFNQESELVNLLKRIPLGEPEFNIIRDRAELLRTNQFKTRGDALLPITLASYILDALTLPVRESKLQLLMSHLRRPGDEKLGFEAATAALGLKANVSEADHPLLCEGTRRQRFKAKRIYPSIPNQPSEAGAHFMFELAKTVLVKAGGNSATSLFTQASTSQNHHGPHRALHMCAFQLGLYALGLHNCVVPNWLSRTYSSHVSWISGQAMEIGAQAIMFLQDTWEGHLTPPEAATMADRASRGSDRNMVAAAAELALSCLPHAHALNPNEIQRAILQCKEQSDRMLEYSCLTVEGAAKRGGVYPDVLFQVARYWYDLYVRNTPAEHYPIEEPFPPPGSSLAAGIIAPEMAPAPPPPQQGQVEQHGAAAAAGSPMLTWVEANGAPAGAQAVPGGPAGAQGGPPQYAPPPIAVPLPLFALQPRRYHPSPSTGLTHHQIIQPQMYTIQTPTFQYYPHPPTQAFYQGPRSQPRTQYQLRYLLAAYRVGMLAMETIARRAHDDRPNAKYARNPPYGDDVKWLVRIAEKLGTQYLQQFCVCVVNSVVSPFILHDVALEAAHYLARNNPALILQHLRTTLTPLVQKCQQMYIQCLHQKLYHLSSAEHDEFINIVLSARAAFHITPEGAQQFKEWLQSIRRSKSCKKELWSQIMQASNGK
ncbi:unnamed protein product [Nesidiocoris tenuis]|uniref:SWIM-type domain-containing protein n=1 Tax=Nesidiocoris tenuis TaxID=355587 RepID=A0A6H5H4P0_9HEMI|nr:unnamed protein product [Nesidiocoris tenuis]